MIKSIFIIILCLFLFNGAFAQKDTSVYYLKTSGKLTSSKDSADFVLVIQPPDTSVDKKLFIVKEFYRTGKIRLIAGSNTNALPLKLQGSQITFFPNGHKMRIRNYENGELIGDEVEYYPNGRLYNIKSYAHNKKIFLQQFNDSTGNILTENGKGKWKEFSENFNQVDAEGDVDNGVEDGLWLGRMNDSVGFESMFNKGKLTSTSRIYRYKTSGEIFTKVDVIPEFPGGLEAFGRFLQKNVHYPAIARENNTQGKVFISFVVERDGGLSNIKVARGIGDGCDEEALRAIELSPRWKPGMLDGKPVRVQFSVPIAFALTSNMIRLSH